MLVAWLPVFQSSKTACGGARHGGNRATGVAAALSSRWVRILSMTSGSSMQAMKCMGALMSRAHGCPAFGDRLFFPMLRA